MGVRVITFFKSDLVKVSKIIENEFEILEGPEDKSQKLTSQEFGYRSIHYIVKLNEKRAELLECSEYKELKAEIQIRTIIENAWAEIEHHWKYKPDNQYDLLDKTLQRRLNALMAVLELVDREFDLIKENFQDDFKSDKILLSSIKDIARNPDLFNDLCNYLIDNEDYNGLLYFTKEAVTNEKTRDKAWKMMALSLAKMENYKGILEIIDNLINLEPNNAIPYIGKGYAFFELGEPTKALTWYDKALKIEPKNILALTYKGNALDDLGKYEEALGWFNKALEINPAYLYALSTKGLVFRNLKRYEEAIQLFDEVLDIEPEEIETLINKGVVLSEIGKYEKALQYFDKVLELEPGNIIALVDKTRVLGHLGKYEEALDWIDRALEIEPENIHALFNKVEVLDRLGKIEEAINLFSRAYEIGPEEFYFKDTIINFSRQIEEAVQLLNKKLEPEQEKIQAALGMSYAKMGNYKEATKWFNSVLQNNPKNKSVLMWKSFALEKLEKYEEALHTLKIVLRNNPDDAIVSYMHARIQSLLGNDDIALEILVSAINLDEQYKSKAKNDIAFEVLKERKTFKKITN